MISTLSAFPKNGIESLFHNSYFMKPLPSTHLSVVIHPQQSFATDLIQSSMEHSLAQNLQRGHYQPSSIANHSPKTSPIHYSHLHFHSFLIPLSILPNPPLLPASSFSPHSTQSLPLFHFERKRVFHHLLPLPTWLSFLLPLFFL